MEDENSWVFDSLVAFLNGPIWSAPLDSFIEEKSLIFEPNLHENEEYKNIFDEFKNLCQKVDFMLGNFMEDIGITPEQFEEACNKGHTYPINFNHNIFEQIWAANDYEMFKRMMTQRNVELQLQALELIEQKYGITPQSFVPQKKERVEAAINAAELMKRQEYLRAQRDKLVALKKEARKKHLGVEKDSKGKSRARPKSAKAAEAVLSGEKATIEPQQLQIRKALAERLKTEVVSNKI
ncbi:ARL2 Bind BART domain containing protein [Asbolus verrucosus]|uniref:Cilia- and flagella-associated protein 36 n=1 Tax=Asbolus verrucosus TaxID=1661398 RepID=A0A482VVZ1_ASBVE|nr:ARL2 Bind BART domain containing protein [Asbolus verrucosus]